MEWMDGGMEGGREGGNTAAKGNQTCIQLSPVAHFLLNIGNRDGVCLEPGNGTGSRVRTGLPGTPLTRTTVRSALVVQSNFPELTEPVVVGQCSRYHVFEGGVTTHETLVFTHDVQVVQVLEDTLYVTDVLPPGVARLTSVEIVLNQLFSCRSEPKTSFC